MTLLYRRVLRIIGVLPFEGRDFTYLGSRLLLAYSFIQSCVNWSMFLFYAINMKTVPAVDTICELVLVIGVSLRYYLLLLHRSQLKTLFDECRAIWELFDQEGRLTVRRFERKVRLLFQLFFCSSVFSGCMYCASAAAFTIRAARDYRQLDDNSTTSPPLYLPYKWYTENGAYLWPGYKVIFLVQALLSITLWFIITSVDTLGPLLIMIAAGFFRALRHRLLNVTRKQPNEHRFELVNCLQLHQRILNVCLRMDNVMRTLFLVQLLCTGYNISLAGIKVIGTDPDKYKFVPMGLLYLGQLFICQWAPDHLIDESLAISTAAYSTSLIWASAGLDKILVMVIARSQRPVQMTAAGCVDLSLENFRAMLASAMSFFTVLRSFNI